MAASVAPDHEHNIGRVGYRLGYRIGYEAGSRDGVAWCLWVFSGLALTVSVGRLLFLVYVR